jgi:cyclohexyl-isocyanide hydratase
VARDGNIVTGGGVTAGIDFGLRLVAELASPEVAQRVQLMLEYDPAPPFRSGHPRSADLALVEAVRRSLEERHAKRADQLRGLLRDAVLA